jgi:hypothetical protein
VRPAGAVAPLFEKSSTRYSELGAAFNVQVTKVLPAPWVTSEISGWFWWLFATPESTSPGSLGTGPPYMLRSMFFRPFEWIELTRIELPIAACCINATP